ncbi:MAG: cupin [Gemmatimonadetes bacterium]|nr:cupin [Gemmatimonadota bacterium]
MKRLLFALAAIVPLASAPIAPIKAGAYHWAELKSVGRVGRVERAVMSGSTLDLDTLDIRAITLPVGGAAESEGTHDDTELFLMVKEGDLWVTINGASQKLGAGSVALALPGDRESLSNKGATPATYYLFTYRSRAPMDLARGKQAGGSFMVDANDLRERPTASGTRRDVLNRPTAMWKRFEAHVSSVNEGLQNHATHTHRADEIMMLTRGDVMVLIGDRRAPATASDVVFLGSMIPHSLNNTGKGPTQYLVIQGE